MTTHRVPHLLALVFLVWSLPALAARCHVDAGAASATHDGQGWATAYTDLQDALRDATCTEVWVAQGVYVPVTPADAESWRDSVRDELVATFDMLERRRIDLPEVLRHLVDRLLAARMALIERLDRLRLPVEGLTKTRYHGDLHFGQVLIAKKDYLIVDFEGEPSRSLAERRRKHSPLRDVAGMVRSADYAARTVLTRLGAGAVERHTAIVDAAREWRQVVSAAFIAGYMASTRRISSVPRDADTLHALLELFILEKALYEARYEMDHRPDWLDVPIGGLLELADTADGC